MKSIQPSCCCYFGSLWKTRQAREASRACRGRAAHWTTLTRSKITPFPPKGTLVLGWYLRWFGAGSTCEPSKNQFGFPWAWAALQPRHHIRHSLSRNTSAVQIALIIYYIIFIQPPPTNLADTQTHTLHVIRYKLRLGKNNIIWSTQLSCEIRSQVDTTKFWLVLLVMTIPAPSLFLLDQQQVGATLEPCFLAETVLWLSKHKKLVRV